MRQKLPESAGYPLVVGEISQTIQPGEVFDAPGLVPGCVELPDEPEPEPDDGKTAGGKTATRAKERTS